MLLAGGTGFIAEEYLQVERGEGEEVGERKWTGGGREGYLMCTYNVDLIIDTAATLKGKDH